MSRKLQAMDGNNAAAYVSYAFTEVAGIYPITPSSPMADYVDQWSAAGQKNIFGTPVNVVEMQSEAGAAGVVHGSLAAGALTTTYTASQGLLLMIPNMYKMAGELLPAVFHVSARCVASHALNIFGDHSDVYACRQTGFGMLSCNNPQEVMDIGAVAHLAAIKGRMPFINFFDGFRTSHELQKIETWDYDELKEMCDIESVDAFRKRALNPERPVMRGSHENGDIFFQHREACNSYYDAVPDIVEEYMNEVNRRVGTNYKPFNYYGAPDAQRVIVAMGSICDVAEEVIDYLTEKGEKVGLVKVRLYRPFSAQRLIDAIPKSAEKIAVLDRTKEPGSLGEPLYLDVVTALSTAGMNKRVVGGRYGLGSKDTPPSSVFAVYEELLKDNPKNGFTIGIVDDVTGLSLPEKVSPNTADPSTIECKFWGLGGDGTVGANKNSITIIGDHTEKYVQAYFQYDSKKTGGITVSHLRFGDTPIRSPYYINKADFVACHNPSYITKGFKMVDDVKPGGVFLINCQWSPVELERHLSCEAKQYIIENDIQLYTIDAIDIADDIGMGKRTNTVLQAAFFKLAGVLPIDEAVKYMKAAADHSYAKKGPEIVEMNHKAIDAGVSSVHKIEVPRSWAACDIEPEKEAGDGPPELIKMVETILKPVAKNEGDSLPVSAFVPHADGSFPQGASNYEKRGVAVKVPEWLPETCIACNKCAFVCPHATIRPVALSEQEVKNAPQGMKLGKKKVMKTDYSYAMTVSPLDCMACGICAAACPTEAIKMVAAETQLHEQAIFDYCRSKVTEKPELTANINVMTSQYKKPLLEFSGSCSGCAETVYARLITQLFGDRMYISNATGCSSIWGGPASASAYAVNAEGKGPTWANSLFEDNAEHGFGLLLGQRAVRERLIEKVEVLSKASKASAQAKAAAILYLDTINDGEKNTAATKALVAALEKCENPCEVCSYILKNSEYLSKKSIWIFGGDGWAYDIGFGGVDHVMAMGQDVNMFVFDTEVYSNTGGQMSKASQIGQVAQFSAAGKEANKKSLSEIAMSYGNVYVAQVAPGADPVQTLKAIKEAEAYPGPSLIIGYSPCEMHSIKGGMVNCMAQMKKAVQSGYWHNFRFNPLLKEQGENPFIMDSKAPSESYKDFIMSEARFSSLTRSFPDRADELFSKGEKAAVDRYEHLLRLGELYGKK